MSNIIEKRKTIDNSKGKILTAKVIANWGDAVPTNDKWTGMIAAVKRPEQLWINVVGDPSNLQRSDYFGNTNVGTSANYSINSIPSINQPYQLGETISIKKLSEPLVLNNQKQDSIFRSAFNTIDSPAYYNSWYNNGAFLPYIQQTQTQNNLRLKTVAKASDTGSNNFYYPILNKYQYEAFSLLQNTSNTELTSILTQIFLGSWNGRTQIYNAHGGYVFNNVDSINFSIIEFEDLNVGNKQRDGISSCLPAVILNPSQYVVPKTRNSGLISYNPTLVQVNI